MFVFCFFKHVFVLMKPFYSVLRQLIFKACLCSALIHFKHSFQCSWCRSATTTSAAASSSSRNRKRKFRRKRPSWRSSSRGQGPCSSSVLKKNPRKSLKKNVLLSNALNFVQNGKPTQQSLTTKNLVSWILWFVYIAFHPLGCGCYDFVYKVFSLVLRRRGLGLQEVGLHIFSTSSVGHFTPKIIDAILGVVAQLVQRQT